MADAGRRGRRQLALFWGAAVLALLILSPFGAQLASLLWPCPFKMLTGLPCPTCGTTRAALALARFDILGALTRYPLQTLAWMVFVLGGVSAALWVLSGRDLPSLPRRLPRWALVLGLTALGANWWWSIATGV